MSLRCKRGFTLLEVIVALTLLSLIMLGLLSALRSLGESSQRTDDNTQRIDQIRLVGDFLRRSIGQAVVQPRFTLEYGYVPYFEGAPEQLLWLAPLPAQHGTGGLHIMQLTATPEGQLLLEYAPYPGFSTTATPSLDNPAKHILLSRVDALGFQYRLDANHPWTPQWEDITRMPGQVRVSLKQEGRAWPDIIIALRASEKPI